MSELPNSRDIVTNYFERIGLELEPPTTAKAEDFVRAVADESRYTGRGLGANHPIEEGSPRHWLFVVPHPAQQYGAYAVEFGMTNHDFTGKGEARFDHEFSIDETLKINADTAAVQKLFPQIGGFVVESVRKRGDLFIAGLELLYKEIGDNEFIQWPHLIYSRGLWDTQKHLEKATRGLHERPGWVNDGLQNKNRGLLAENMALSVLCATRKLI